LQHEVDFLNGKKRVGFSSDLTSYLKKIVIIGKKKNCSGNWK